MANSIETVTLRVWRIVKRIVRCEIIIVEEGNTQIMKVDYEMVS